jgi:hypothetical protein
MFFRCIQPSFPVRHEFSPRFIDSNSKATLLGLPIKCQLVGIMFGRWNPIGYKVNSRAVKLERCGGCWSESISCGTVESIKRRISLWVPERSVEGGQGRGRTYILMPPWAVIHNPWIEIVDSNVSVCKDGQCTSQTRPKDEVGGGH